MASRRANAHSSNFSPEKPLDVLREALFRQADEAFRQVFDEEAREAIVRSSLEFLERAGPELAAGGSAVELVEPSLERDGWRAPGGVLRIALADRPFIVDSVRAALRREGVAVQHVLHPTLWVERDAAGGVVALQPRRAATSGGAATTGGAATSGGAVGVAPEALELWFVELEEGEGGRAAAEERVVARVRQVLADLLVVTEDFEPMRAAVQRLAAELDAHAERLRADPSWSEVPGGPEALQESAEFLRWLDDGHFVFLGLRTLDRLEVDGEPAMAIAPNSGLGLLRRSELSHYATPVALASMSPALRERLLDPRALVLTQTKSRSSVRRDARMEYLSVGRYDDQGRRIGEHRILGLFNSKAISESATDIPLLRGTLQRIFELDGAVAGSHDYRQILLIFNSLPRAELFAADPVELHREIRAMMSLEEERGVRLLLRPDALGRGVNVTVRMPRDRFNAEVRRAIQGHLAEVFAAESVDYQLALGDEGGQARLHFFLISEVRVADVDRKALEEAVVAMAQSWRDRLQRALQTSFEEREAKRLLQRYGDAFDARYQADTGAAGALADIAELEAFERAEQLEEGAVRIDVRDPLGRPGGGAQSHVRVFYRGDRLVLSDVLPMLEHLGFRVLEQVTYRVELASGALALAVFKVTDQFGEPIDLSVHRARLIEAATAILSGRAEHDRLSRLVLYGALSIREVALLRALQMYTVQLNAVTSRRFVTDTLVRYPRSARALVELFEIRFNPARFADDRRELRAAAEEECFADFVAGLGEVATLTEETVLRNLADLVRAMVRSNYHRDEPWIAFKIDSARVSNMPSPRPLFEIGVASPTLEGTHLRGGPVARGGIRWSDRPDDFRTEVLGLMKTQMTKNAVIVPVGSKGGFVVKRAPSDREALRAHVQEQYRGYVRALLGLTDNIVQGELVRPQGLVLYDEPDPYLVVAADKGTATFSDTANAIAAELGFWLGDAFASGGSVGYDHKAWGITARGAWAAVERHFRDLGRDPKRDVFSAVGIGDMSGDVFGNGLLYTDRVRLLAAFDHRHIFLDPDPDPAGSFAERQRLFALPRSSWADYDPARISAGGGVYERHAKRIELSEAAQRALGVEASALSGEALVQAVLRAPVDLLWNGGIGTYVKASSEQHAQVGDASNDAVRVDASELRAKIVGEGGNLGFTQRARIEFARLGGRIHTDAIDNSGGVDLSDHEVNLKLALQPLVASGALQNAERDALLMEVAEEVCELVLRNNASQALALALAERRSRADAMLFDSLIEYLSSRGTLDPVVEQLPDRRAIAERARAGEGLTRPELAIVMAYVKMGVFRRLLATDLPDEPYFRQRYLEGYFPSAVVARHPEAVHAHPLRREILSTTMTNRVIDLLGMTWIHRIIRDTNASTIEVVRAALIALEVLDVAGFEARLAAQREALTGAHELDALGALVGAIEGVVRWMLLDDLSGVDIEAFVRGYREPLATVRVELPELLPPAERRRHLQGVRRLVKGGIPEALAVEMAAFTYLPSAMAVVEVAQRTRVALSEVGRRFFAVGERLRLGYLRDELRELPAADVWENIAAHGLVMDLRQTQRAITEGWLRGRQHAPRLTLEAFLGQTPNVIHRYDAALARILEEDALSLASAGVVVRLLGRFAEERA